MKITRKRLKKIVYFVPFIMITLVMIFLAVPSLTHTRIDSVLGFMTKPFEYLLFTVWAASCFIGGIVGGYLSLTEFLQKKNKFSNIVLIIVAFIYLRMGSIIAQIIMHGINF